MKVTRFLLVPALMLGLAGSSYGQMPQGPGPTYAPPMNPGSMSPKPMMQGPMSQGPMGDAGMAGGGGMMSPDCYPMQMAEGPVYDDCNPQGRFGDRFRKRTSRGYVLIDAMLISRNDATARTIATGATAPNTVVDAGDPYVGFETVPRITAGYVLMNDLAIEGTIFYKDDFDAIYDGFAAAPGSLNSSIFAFPATSPVAPNNINNQNTNYRDFDYVNLRASTGIHSYELNVVETSHVFNFIAGFRYMEVRDQLMISVSDSSGVNVNNGTSPTYLGTYNHLMGTQFGVKTGKTWELVTFDTSVKAGMYINDAQSTVNIRDLNNTSQVVPVRHTGGQNEAFVGDFAANLTLRLGPSIGARLGYQCMFITEVALAADQINPTSPAQTGLSQNARGDLFLHGPNAGIDFRW